MARCSPYYDFDIGKNSIEIWSGIKSLAEGMNENDNSLNSLFFVYCKISGSSQNL